MKEKCLKLIIQKLLWVMLTISSKTLTKLFLNLSYARFILGCYDWFQQLSWMDGMPVVFNYPVEQLPSYDDFSVELSDGTLVTPDCTLLRPANEQNERDTIVLLGNNFL